VVVVSIASRGKNAQNHCLNSISHSRSTAFETGQLGTSQYDSEVSFKHNLLSVKFGNNRLASAEMAPKIHKSPTYFNIHHKLHVVFLKDVEKPTIKLQSQSYGATLLVLANLLLVFIAHT